MIRRLTFCLLAAGLGAVLWAAAPAHGQIRPLPAPHADTSFGVAVALEDGRALVGASGEDACGKNSGAAYIFEKRNGSWQRAARLVPSDCEAGAFFGRSLALSGGRVIVGASKEFFADERPNVAYVFERDSTTEAWNETARLTVNPRRAEGTFAASVDLDGSRALVTSRGVLPNPELSAAEVAPSVPPPEGAGAAYVFERNARTGHWRRRARLTPHQPDPGRAFGGVGALDGSRLAVTASPYFSESAGAVYIFELRGPHSEARWEQVARLEGFDGFSIPVALDRDYLLVGESRAGDEREGGAVLFRRSRAGAWQEQARLQPRTPYRDGAFGTAVALGAGRALVTGYDEQLGLGFNIDRVCYVFEQVGDGPQARWRQRRVLDMGDVSFGTAIALHGASALVGHVPDHGSGAAYVIGL